MKKVIEIERINGVLSINATLIDTAKNALFPKYDDGDIGILTLLGMNLLSAVSYIRESGYDVSTVDDACGCIGNIGEVEPCKFVDFTTHDRLKVELKCGTYIAICEYVDVDWRVERQRDDYPASETPNITVAVYEMEV